MAKRLTKAQMREAAQAFGRQGGKKRKALLSPEQRRQIASAASTARWARLTKAERQVAMREVAQARKAKRRKPTTQK